MCRGFVKLRLSRAILVREKRRTRGRDRLAVSRTRSRRPCPLIGCSRQPVVLQTASRSLPERLMVKIMRSTGNKHLSSSPAGAECLPARTRHLPQIHHDSMRMKQPNVRKRKRLALFRTTGCREQPISAQGWLERVLKRAKRFRLMARPISRTRFVPTVGSNAGLYSLPFSGSLRPICSWLETQSSEEMAAAREISPASTVPATISANLLTLPTP